MKSYEFTGKNVEEATKKGLNELGKNLEDVDIQILSEGGFLRKAKIVINVEEEPTHHFVPTPKPETKKEEPKPEVKEEPQVLEEVIEEVVEIVEVKPNVEEEKLEAKEEKRPSKKELTPAEKEQAYLEKHTENNTTSAEFIDGLLKLIGVEASVSVEEKREESRIVIETEEVGKVVGHRGELLSAIQYLATTIEAKTNPNAKRVVVDCANYKQKHEESLRALAIKIAGRVSETGKTYKMRPMPASDRRIVHTELLNYPSVETHSEGYEPNRFIVVTKKR